jgi:hypothetical protein
MRHDLVVCAYGDSPYLPECLHSLAQQQGEGTVITVASSTPSPYQRSAAKAAGARFEVNQNPPSIGSDWNFALSVGVGPLVTLCHQDDAYLPRFASRTHDLFANHPDLILVSTGHMETLATGPRDPSFLVRVKRMLMRNAFRGLEVRPAREIRHRLLGFGNPIACSSVTFNKVLLGDFAFSTNMGSNLDWDAWSRLAETPFQFGYIQDILLLHRVHRNSATTQLIANNTRAREDQEMFNRYWPRSVAKALLALYRRSYASNDVGG